MSNYPDGTWEGDPRAPWNQEPPACTRCKDELDGDAWEQSHLTDGPDGFPIDQHGWPGGLCTNCAGADYEKLGCSCDESGFCCLTCKAKYDKEMQAAEEEVRRSPSTWTGGDNRGEHDPTL